MILLFATSITRKMEDEFNINMNELVKKSHWESNKD